MSAIQTLVDAIAQHPNDEIEKAKRRVLCGAPTANGGTCQFKTFGGRCPTHSLSREQIARRNRKVARKFAFNDADGFRMQRQRAGRAGFLATGEKHGWERATKMARDYRENNPSIPEQYVMDALFWNGIAYEREVFINGDLRAVDFKIGDRIVEVNAHPSTPQKVEWLRGLGYEVLVVNLTIQDCLDNTAHARAEKQKILEFVKDAKPSVQAPDFDELPF